MRKRWIVPEVDVELRDRLAKDLPCSPLLASLLLRRGIHDAAAAASFLEPKLIQLADPAELPDMEAAVARIEEAVRRGESIAVFGDYDVDGVSSTCLLLDFFDQVGIEVRGKLPHRLEDGYGLKERTVRELAGQGVRLLITVDNGSSSRREVALAGELGMDVVVTDHHQPPEDPPEGVPFVNPRRIPEGGGFRDLAGVGVTFKLVWALCQRFSKAKKIAPSFREFLMDSLALVALGTISDVVPLRGENRVLARFGLRALERSRRPGLRQLVALATPRRGPRDRLRARDVGFGIGPRINAVGRLGQAEVALRLLRTESEEEAERIGLEIDRQNRRRREIEREIFREARERVRGEIDLARERAIVLAGQWHSGVIGIVASRLVEEFYRPTFLIALEGARGRGSARSIPGVGITHALERCSHLLIGFGGHELAAGFEVESGRVEELRRALSGAIEIEPDRMVPEVEADSRIDLGQIDGGLLREIAALAPFGEGNPEPLLAVGNLEVVGRPRCLGADGSHLAFHVRERGRSLRAIAFGKGEWADRLETGAGRVSLLFRPAWNEWQGQREIELRVSDMQVPGRS